MGSFRPFHSSNEGTPFFSLPQEEGISTGMRQGTCAPFDSLVYGAGYLVSLPIEGLDRLVSWAYDEKPPKPKRNNRIGMIDVAVIVGGAFFKVGNAMTQYFPRSVRSSSRRVYRNDGRTSPSP